MESSQNLVIEKHSKFSIISNHIQKLVVLSSFITLFCMLSWLYTMSNYGIDFTDESFYVNWMAHPDYYKTSFFQFGFIYHPLYLLLDGNIPHLRQANVFITFILGWIFSFIFLQKNETEFMPLKIQVLFSALLASGCFIFNSSLITPNYNSLGFNALLLAGFGCLLIVKDYSKIRLLGAVLVGISGWLSAMAKPTSAIALGLNFVIFLRVSGKSNWRLVFISILTALIFLFCSIHFIDGSISTFYYRISKELQIFSLMSSGHSITDIFRVNNYFFSKFEKNIFYGLTFGLSISIWALSNAKTKSIGLVFSFLCQLFSIAIIVGLFVPDYNLSVSKGMLMLCVPFASVLGMILVTKKPIIFKQITRYQWSLALFFLVLPHIFAFGSNRNYWVVGSAASIFWVLSGFAISMPTIFKVVGWPGALPLISVIQLITTIQLSSGFEKPQRQPQSLRLNNKIVSFGANSKLVLSAGWADYIIDVQNKVTKSGFIINSPVIDMTGHNPGTLFLIGAKPLGQPWLIGGYKGSDYSVQGYLDLHSCEELVKAWILVEPEGPRKISFSILEKFGIRSLADYVTVAEFKTASGAGGHSPIQKQFLLKPGRDFDIAIEACDKERNANPSSTD